MINFSVLLAYAAAVVTAGLAVYVASRDPKNPVSRIFAVGMALFALEAFLSGMALQADQAGDFLLWYRAKTIAASLLPGMWLIFSLTYGRANYREFLTRWKPVIIAVFVIPVLFPALIWGSWFTGRPVLGQAGTWYLALGWGGYFWSLAIIAGAILILMNLERTLRHSTGRKRWQIKFMIVGAGVLFGVRIYTSSLALLFNQVATDNLALQAGVLLAADVLIARSVLRTREMAIDIYLSHAFLHSSLTIFLIGAYFVGVGLLAWLAQAWIGIESLPLTAFLLFAAVMGLGSVLLSDHVRLRRKRLVSRLFERPMYDYRQVWSRFTEATSSISTTKDLCNALCRMVSETLECLSVSIWIVDEGRDALVFGASTDLSEERARSMKMSGQAGTELILALWDQDMPVDFRGTGDDWVHDFSATHADALAEADVHYAVPLRAANRLAGILTLSGRIADAPLTAEDAELLKTISDQAAASLLNIRFAEHLHKAKALEALQMMSAFFMHDLKNLGSKLSLVTQNLPVHFENPEFRQDAIRSVTQSVAKINNMCSRLSLLSERLEIQPRQASLDRIVTDALKSLDGMFKVPVLSSLGNVTEMHVDGEQIQKVIVNLLLNANEAVAGDGQIGISTSRDGGWAQLAVSDTGCGMSREFIETRLFRPFQTTKPKGMGIGLFHCKTIVEAHGGRIEVESEEGKGSTFRVFLPGKPGSRVEGRG
jgi:putative PEP-CTERM system histidine kinase